MNSLSNHLHEFARERRIDLLGIAPVGRFEGVPAQHHPASIFPETRSVIVLGKRITRGTLRGVEEGTQFDLYSMFGQSWLADRVLAVATVTLAQFIEDHGWEAVPLQDLPPEVPPSGVAVRPGLPPPNVMIDFRDAAIRAGLGRYGWCGELLTPRFGPRQRFQMILTDAELDPTPLCTEPVCDQCGNCAAACPLDAIEASGEHDVEVCGLSMRVAGIDLRKCAQCRNGATPNASHPAGKPDRLGALCVRTCMDHLEESGRISNRFTNPFRVRPAWRTDSRGNTALWQADAAEAAEPGQ
jgi:epoxyqueuosine reductase QueG